MLYKQGRPDAVIGFGGYPAVPALLAASGMGIPTILHEQNAVLGRANRYLAGDAEAIATAYTEVERLKPRFEKKAVLVGNPVREAISRLGEVPFPPFDEYAPFKILVTGGSQGATVLSRVVPGRARTVAGRRSGFACRSCSSAGPTTSTRSARAMPNSEFRPS